MACRSYKNGFVWHDLCEDDLILPAHGNEYVLKGSELFEDSNSGNQILAFVWGFKWKILAIYLQRYPVLG